MQIEEIKKKVEKVQNNRVLIEITKIKRFISE